MAKERRFHSPFCARKIAINALLDVLQKKMWSNLAFKKWGNQAKSSKILKEAAALFYGTLTEYVGIEYQIRSLLKKNNQKIDQEILAILSLSIYSLRFSKNVSEPAVVHEAVKLTKALGLNSATGFVNAVLRSFLRTPVVLPEDKPYLDLSVEPSLYHYLVEALGKEDAIAFLRVTKKATPVTVRIRDLQQLSEIEEKYKNQLNQASFIPFAKTLKNFNHLMDFPLIKSGEAVIMGEAAMLPALILNPQPQDLVADFCAAPGNKSCMIADLKLSALSMNLGDVVNSSPFQEGLCKQIDVFEPYEHRMELLRDRAKQLNLSDAFIYHKQDSRDLKNISKYFSYFDKILLDLPCSSWGLIGKKPELRLKAIDKDELASLYKLQSELLDSAATCLKSGGLLVYSTCTVNPQENLLQLEAFLENHSEFSLEAFVPSDLLGQTFWTFDHLSKTAKKGYVLLLPHQQGFEGFFVAKLRKNIDNTEVTTMLQ